MCGDLGEKELRRERDLELAFARADTSPDAPLIGTVCARKIACGTPAEPSMLEQ